MANASQQQPTEPCPCQQQLVGALPWLAATLAIIVVLDRWRGRRRKQKQSERHGAAGGETKDGGER